MRLPPVAPTRRAIALRILAPGLVVAGWVDLARGGLTLGPVLLVAGYLVFVPALLLDT